MLGESYAKEFQKIPPADNTMGRRIADISEDLCDQLTDQLKTSHFTLQVDKAIDVIKDAHSFTYVWNVLENDIKGDLSFCKSINGTVMPLKVFDTINHFLGENEINWEKCIGLYCTEDTGQCLGKMQDFRHC
jgi:hypothetical protein